MIEITTFQALTILLHAYQGRADSKDTISQILNLYLVGIRSEEDRVQLAGLLADPLLQEYRIVSDKSIVYEDPVRRYFESQLCHETLKNTLADLDKKMLKKHYKSVFAQIPFLTRLTIPFFIYRGDIDGLASKRSATAPEYIAAIKKIQDPNSFQSLKRDIPGDYNDILANAELKEYKKKMLLLVKTAHAAMTADSQRSANAFPLNLKDDENSLYAPQNRGRINRWAINSSTDSVMSHNMGIMRDYMPLARSDALFDEHASQYMRPTDRSTFVEGALVPEQTIEKQVLPFVNSISGLMLANVRIMAKLFGDNSLHYANNIPQFRNFFKSMISYMLLNSGGHSLDEFSQVLQLAEVKAVFAQLPGFDDFQLRHLFQTENETAFLQALERTKNYCLTMILRKGLHEQITNRAILQTLQFEHTSQSQQVNELEETAISSPHNPPIKS